MAAVAKKPLVINRHSMLDTTKIQALLFDFGGTIDTGGLHWIHVLYPLWEQRHPGLDPALYQQAFAHAERSLATAKIIQPTDNFLDLLEKKLAIQARFLKENGLACSIRDQKFIADEAYQEALENCRQHAGVLKLLRQKYRIAMVSNFYGNLQTVLKDFGIRDLFETVTESAVAGVKKPDPAIWQLGADSLRLAPAATVAIGDSLSKDMQPATRIGAQGIWIVGKGWEDIPGSITPDIISQQHQQQAAACQVTPVSALSQLPSLLLDV